MFSVSMPILSIWFPYLKNGENVKNELKSSLLYSDAISNNKTNYGLGTERSCTSLIHNDK